MPAWTRSGTGVATCGHVTDVSDVLRAERERAGLTLEEISSRTKIKVTLLQALERGEFERLPGEFFTRAFIRTYARELHLSPEQVVAAYDARFAPAPSGEEARDEHQPALAPTAVSSTAERRLFLPSPRSVWPTIALAGAILVVVSVMNRPARNGSNQAGAVGTTGVGEAAKPEAAPAPVEAAPEKLTIEIQPARVMWVAGTADGKRVIYRLVEPGERVRLDAQNEFWFRVGDAGAFMYSINGSASKPLGNPGEVREFSIDRENYKTLGR